MRELCASLTQLNESLAYDGGGLLTVTVIKPGFNVSKSRFYPAEVLRRDHKIFEGAKMFADHQTDAEAKARPEGSVDKWVGQLKRTWISEDGSVMGAAHVIDPSFRAKLDALKTAGMMTEMGISIRAVGEAKPKQVEGVETNHVEALLKSRSVDFVTYAGAGGKCELMEAAVANDFDLISEEQLRECRPDLVELIESKKEQTMEKSIQDQLADAVSALAVAEAKNAELNAKIEESATKVRIAETAAALDALLKDSKLPELAQTRMKKQFSTAEKTDGMQEAIELEKEYVKALTKGAGVKHMGADDNKEVEESEKEVDLVASFKRMGMDEEAAKIAADF